MSANLEAPRPLAPLLYAAETDCGAVHLALPASTDALVDDSAAVAAVRLASVEPLLQRLDDWLAPITGPLCWEWATRQLVSSASRATLRSLIGGAEVSLPWPLLRRAGSAPDALHAQIEWPEVDAALMIDRFDLDDDDVAALEPGGVVLLPASFGAEAPTWVRGPDGLTAPTRPAPPEGHWSITCPLAQRCSLPQAAGWVVFDRRPALARHAQLWHGEHLHAVGELIPWGQGRALRLLSWT